MRGSDTALRLLLLMVICGSGVGCTSPGSLAPQFENKLSTREAALHALIAQTPTVDPEDLIEPGDTLEVIVRRGAGEERYTTTVRANGLITVAFIDIDVKGLTEADAEARITEELQSVIRNPRVQVRIAQKAALRPKNFYVLGEVRNPGKYQLGRRTTLLQALSQANGFTDVAALDKVVIISRLGEQPQIRVANLETVLVRGDISADSEVQPNDVIFVPRNAVGDWNVYMSKIQPAIYNVLGIVNGVFIGKALEVLFRTPVAQPPAAAVTAPCWIARTLYGEQAWQVNLLRWYIWGPFSEQWQGRVFAGFYLKHGEQIAQLLRRYPSLQILVRPFFDHLVAKGLEALGRRGLGPQASIPPTRRLAAER